jgi:hypothetical protein
LNNLQVLLPEHRKAAQMSSFKSILKDNEFI